MNYSGSDVTVTFNLTAPYMLEEVHVYVGNDILATNNGDFTIAPGQYPDIASDLGGISSYTFNLSGYSGDVYLVAHATVSGF